MHNYCHLFSLLALPTWLIVTIVIVAIAVTVVVLSAGVYSRRFVYQSQWFPFFALQMYRLREVDP